MNFKTIAISILMLGMVVYIASKQYSTNHLAEINLNNKNLAEKEKYLKQAKEDSESSVDYALASNSIEETDLSYKEGKVELDDKSEIIEPQEEKQKIYSEEEIQEIVKNYVLENPELIMQAVDKLQEKARQEASKKREEVIKKFNSNLNSSNQSIYLGNPESNNIIVMFLDYNCGYSKKSMDVINKILEKNTDVKVILRNYPILGEMSSYLAKMVTAIHLLSPEKFVTINNELISRKITSKLDFEKILLDNDLEISTITTKANSSDIKQIIDDNLALGSEMGIQGVPAFVINGKFYPGFLSEEFILNLLSHNDQQ